jgi:O-antigen/teichoic acid export membrane protein
MEVSVSPVQRLAGIFLTLVSLASLVGFGVASWIAGIELFGGRRSSPDHWLGLALGLIFALGFAAGAVASWAEYKRDRMGRASLYAVTPYLALAACWFGLHSLAR